jgi:hypothetical protein
MIDFNNIKIGDIVRFCNKNHVDILNEVEYYGIVVQKVKARKEVSIRWLNHKYLEFDYPQSYEIGDMFWSVVDTANERG